MDPFATLAPAAAPDDPEVVIRLLDMHGRWGLQHLRLAEDFNDLVRDGVERKLGSGVSLYLTANAHANMALIYLRKLLDKNPKTVSVPYLLTLTQRMIPALARRLAKRASETRLDAGELHRRVAENRKGIEIVRKQARPVLAVVNKIVVHLDGDHVRKPIARVPTPLVRRCFAEVQVIVNGWDQAWRGARVLWDHPAYHSHFAPIDGALRR